MNIRMICSWSTSFLFQSFIQVALSFKGTDPLKIDQIFHFFFFFLRKVYTFSSSFIWYDNHYRGATRSTSGRGTKVARSLKKEAQCRSAPTFEWRASVCGEAVPIVSGLLLNILLFCLFLSLKLFTGRNFEARTLWFVLFGSLRVSKQ